MTEEKKITWQKVLQFLIEVIKIILAVFGGIELASML